MLVYMSKSYFDTDYFEAGDDPSLHFLLEQYPQRKPSYDEILPCFSQEEQANSSSHATCDSPKSGAQEAAEATQGPKKTKKKRDSPKTLP